MTERRRTSYSLNWAELEAEYMSGNETVNVFLKRKNISMNANVQGKVRDWREKREKMRQRALKKLATKTSTVIANNWEKYLEAHRILFAHLRALLGEIAPDGTITQPLSVDDARKLVGALKELAQSESFINGGPTEVVENRNVHGDIMRVIHDVTPIPEQAVEADPPVQDTDQGPEGSDVQAQPGPENPS